ncbi:C1 family peptidase [Sinomonas sp. G460-2]|uniref:C1 family peptidase n=1 Tax=Sinomonas sp. G460-2 TaxID=3393464 RepID=UPI0039EE0532
MTTESSPRTNHSYGWVPDVPDQRDHLFAAPPAVLGALPPSADLTAQCPPVYDQGQLGSCTANAIAAALEFDADKQGITGYATPSRLFIYYNERVMEGTVASDSGAQIRDGIKSVGAQGACPETEWPYVIAQFAVQPTQQCYIDAKQHRAVAYQRVSRTLQQMQGCLAAGYPFVFGFTVYESFESQQVAQSGIAPMPAPNEQVLGGHAVVAVGYDNTSQRFRVRNSWGTGWGQAGYFTLPYQYLLSTGLSSDFWTVRTVS